MDAALLWLLIAAARGGTPRRGGTQRGDTMHRRGAMDRASPAPLRRRLHARSAWLRALEEIALIDRRMKPSPVRKLW